MTLLRALAVMTVAAWLGIMAFFSFEVAPVVFKTIDRAIAGQAVTAVLPRYSRWGLALSGIALVASALQASPASRAACGRCSVPRSPRSW